MGEDNLNEVELNKDNDNLKVQQDEVPEDKQIKDDGGDPHRDSDLVDPPPLIIVVKSVVFNEKPLTSVMQDYDHIDPPLPTHVAERVVISEESSVSEWRSGSVGISEDPSTSMIEVSFLHDSVITEQYLSAGTSWRTLLASVDHVSDFALPPRDDYHIRPHFRIRE